jgi:hypothetical protein
VHRAGKVFFAAYLSSVYIERASLAELREAIAVRESFLKIFAKPVDIASKAGLQLNHAGNGLLKRKLK